MAGDLPVRGVVNLLFFALLFNLGVMAVGFAIVGGLAFFTGRGGLGGLFVAASSFLMLLATVVGFLRSAIIKLLADFSGLSETSEPTE
jgi:hypothetical protein